ncbi:MAG: hypothetical protein DRH21_06525 [Deltaproteobacteria bacterium]|nr:MAG: hypothetical protein DRH21_06525 [Deltaproteobacteria bacterium]
MGVVGDFNGMFNFGYTQKIILAILLCLELLVKTKFILLFLVRNSAVRLLAGRVVMLFQNVLS